MIDIVFYFQYPVLIRRQALYDDLFTDGTCDLGHYSIGETLVWYVYLHVHATIQNGVAKLISYIYIRMRIYEY